MELAKCNIFSDGKLEWQIFPVVWQNSIQHSDYFKFCYMSDIKPPKQNKPTCYCLHSSDKDAAIQMQCEGGLLLLLESSGEEGQAGRLVNGDGVRKMIDMSVCCRAWCGKGKKPEMERTRLGQVLLLFLSISSHQLTTYQKHQALSNYNLNVNANLSFCQDSIYYKPPSLTDQQQQKGHVDP